jgi:hypothetical protein
MKLFWATSGGHIFWMASLFSVFSPMAFSISGLRMASASCPPTKKHAITALVCHYAGLSMQCLHLVRFV